jgi:trimethylamine--corrinoid protein Co-methyltransferase
VNAKKIDYQGGYEKSIPALISALSGANGVHLHGAIHAELTHHPVQAIVDDDVAGMIGRFLRGIQIDDETLALNLISQVGAIPGHFLDKAHTRRWWKTEQFLPAVADRVPLAEWQQTKSDVLTNARQRLDKILASHAPTPLPPAAEEEIDRILADAQAYFRKKEEL